MLCLRVTTTTNDITLRARSCPLVPASTLAPSSTTPSRTTSPRSFLPCLSPHLAPSPTTLSRPRRASLFKSS
ncbi:hypothetical protein QC763_0012320 [Podospora pseudopauciseta]|uniref:Uncharacterized protein n=2 Tax=Podospora TaxID=5144 RepID=A0ABR0HZF1_9PEZI|nr:hypothetical protein QC763_0012320 [Podospora pseudopauciseta]KAK4681772.1 hypothetical protein QC764_0012390 [Podospora pseudoanserina]